MPTMKTDGPPKNAGAIEDALFNERKVIPTGVKAAAEVIQPYLEAKVSEPWPPPSAPGQPAHLRTGKYMRAWEVRAADVTLTIRNTVKYAGFLEFGTKFMAARPALTDAKGSAGNDARNMVRKAGHSAADTARRNPLLRGPV